MRWPRRGRQDVALDVRNVYWLLAAMTIVVAPHLLRLPTWVSIFFTVVLGWRAWISWSALRTPPRIVMWSITIAATVGTFVTHRRYTRRSSRKFGTSVPLMPASFLYIR